MYNSQFINPFFVDNSKPRKNQLQNLFYSNVQIFRLVEAYFKQTF